MNKDNPASLPEHHYKRLLQHCSRNMLDIAYTAPLVAAFLQRFPRYAPALRLRGLIYNFALAQEPVVAVDDPRFQIILESLEQALQADPTHTLTLIDLGDYWQERGNLHHAIRYYRQALTWLQAGHYVDDLQEELETAQHGLAQAQATLQDMESPEGEDEASP